MTDTNTTKTIFIVEPEHAGARLDKLLASRYQADRSRAYFQWLIDNNHVRVNGKIVKKQHRLIAFDQVEVLLESVPSIELTPEPIDFRILYEDEAILAIDKPSGLVVHPAPGNWQGTFANGLLNHCQKLWDSNTLRPGIVHRLDKDTSGVLVAAKTPLAHNRLVEQFAARLVEKEYLAICLGNPGNGRIEQAIERHPVERKKMRVTKEGGKSALTRYETMHFNSRLSLVRLEPLTGRTHQIRVHLHYLRTPVLGDPIYGSPSANKQHRADRQLLHAHKLRLSHPISGNQIQFEAPLPADMLNIIQKEQLL